MLRYFFLCRDGYRLSTRLVSLNPKGKNVHKSGGVAFGFADCIKTLSQNSKEHKTKNIPPPRHHSIAIYCIIQTELTLILSARIIIP